MKTKIERLEERNAKLNTELHHIIDQRDALQATVNKQQAEIDNLVAWAMGDRDALSCLQSIYNSTTASEVNRVKAAAVAVAYERSKPAATTINLSFYDRVRKARLEADAKLLEQAPKQIEHIPEPPLPESA